MTIKQPKFIVLESRASSSGKSYWAIWSRGDGYNYNELIARVYKAEWAEKLAELLNEACHD